MGICNGWSLRSYPVLHVTIDPAPSQTSVVDSFSFCPTYRPWQSCLIQMLGLNCVCVPGPFCSDDCVLWWEPYSCSVVAQCLSPPSLCLVNTWSVPVRWETHENGRRSDVIPFFSFFVHIADFYCHRHSLCVCRHMTTPSLRYRGHSPSGVDLGWH